MIGFSNNLRQHVKFEKKIGLNKNLEKLKTHTNFVIY